MDYQSEGAFMDLNGILYGLEPGEDVNFHRSCGCLVSSTVVITGHPRPACNICKVTNFTKNGGTTRGILRPRTAADAR